MNYKKLISKRISGLAASSSNGSAPVIALLAGLAAGAALAILFAPDSGKNTRERISDKALDLADNAKDNFLSIKDKITNGAESLAGLKDRIVDQVKSKIDDTTQEYKEFRQSELLKGSVITSDDHHV